MDINELKEYVDSKIKENGKQEITGPVLNKVLNSTIDTLNDTASATTASAVEKLEGKITEETTARVQADDTMQADIATLKAIPIKKGKGIGAVIANDIEDNAAGGIYATAFGFITKAGGDSSFAEGYLTSARGGSLSRGGLWNNSERARISRRR